MCVLCLSKTTQLLFYRVVHQGIQSQVLLQRYGNICNREGEYHPAAMIICPPSEWASALGGALLAPVQEINQVGGGFTT